MSSQNHSALVEATQAPGQVGLAAKELAQPLGLLAALASGDKLSEELQSAASTMTNALRAELPRMIEEHKPIRAAVEKLRSVARAEGLLKYEQLAEQLALHAQTEEEVLYPAAVLAGDVIRMRK